MQSHSLLADSIPAAPRRSASIDISRWLEGVTLVLSEPDVPAQFRAADVARQLRIDHALWPDRLCLIVSLLAVSHVSPAFPIEEGPLPFYAAIAERNPAMWEHVTAGFLGAFPAVDDLSQAQDDAKNA